MISSHSHKQEFVLSLDGGNGRKGEDEPGYRSPHRRRYPDGCALPPSSAEMLRQRAASQPAPLRPARDERGRFTGRRVG